MVLVDRDAGRRDVPLCFPHLVALCDNSGSRRGHQREGAHELHGDRVDHRRVGLDLHGVDDHPAGVLRAQLAGK